MPKFQVIVADPPWAFKDTLKMSDVARGAQANYSTMTISQIKQLSVKDIVSDDGAVLALWVPSSLLQEGLDTMKAWGFSHKQTYIWVKTKYDPLLGIRNIFFDFWKDLEKPIGGLTPKRLKKAMLSGGAVLTTFTQGAKLMAQGLAFGMGRLFRQTHEICLIGTTSNKIYQILENKSQRSVCIAPNERHSAKPEGLQDSLDIMFPKAEKLEMFARRIRPGWTCIGNEVTAGEDIRVSLHKLNP